MLTNCYSVFMKKQLKSLVASILGWQVKKLKSKNNFKIVAVVGSIGKTSTKYTIAQMLSGGMRVRYQKGNYNDLVSVPLVFFDESMPSLLNPLAWAGIFIRNQKQIRKNYAYDVVVVELGTDEPGQIAEFKRYIKADITVVSALTPEHMEQFKTLDAVIKEELSVAEYSDLIIYNKDLCPANAVSKLRNAMSYSNQTKADYYLTGIKRDGANFKVTFNGEKRFELEMTAVSETQLYSLLAGTTVAEMLGMGVIEIQKQAKTIKAMPGRMNVLRGKNDSTIIDDTYNASPEAVKMALETLMGFKAKKRIAILGSMNELGENSPEFHKDIGAMCDPKLINEVVTIGAQAREFLASAAEGAGCNVKSFDSPVDAGKYVAGLLDSDTVVLAKGSQNRVFSEEAVKKLLASKDDEKLLVRQSAEWINVKRKQFREV